MTKMPSQSLINEYKGNLFEYLVAEQISKKTGCEKKFLLSIDKNLKKNLQTYQEKLRELDNQLITSLPILAEQTSKEIIAQLAFIPTNISLVGKLGAHPNSTHSEVDILLSNERNQYPISLKLSKKGTATHTKSAGLKSFFLKYFSNQKTQSLFNEYLEMIYHKMAVNLHELEDISFDNNFEQWKNAGLTELPGELNQDQKAILSRCYFELINKVYDELIRLQNEDADIIKLGLYRLMGFHTADIIQVKCLYEHQKNRYQYINTEFFRPVNIKNIDIQFIKPKENQASLIALLGEDKLQLRIKPMNKFTVPGYKLNCALIS